MTSRVVVVGGGVAGAEALLALRELAGDRIALTLVEPRDELVLPPLSVAEAFALGHAPHYPLQPLLEQSQAEHLQGSLSGVNPERQAIRLQDGSELEFDALLLAPGARPVARVEHATTWWPRGDGEAFSGLVRDLEEGYTKDVAFVLPPGPTWPLPLYELALMTAREVQGMGMDDVELTVITPEAVPLALFGDAASQALQEELREAGIAFETATVARVERGHRTTVVLQPSTRRLEVDRVVALPAVEGPRVEGTTQNDDGFILVDRDWRMRGSDRVWVAGDAVAYPVKFGGLAAQQADAAAAGIANSAGADVAVPAATLKLRGVLMTGARPRALGDRREGTEDGHAAAPLWRPEEKVFGSYLSPFLRERQPEERAAQEDAPTEVAFESEFPPPDQA